MSKAYRIAELQRKLVAEETKRNMKQNELSNTEAKLIAEKELYEDIETSQAILQSTAKSLQNKLSIKINEFVSYALSYVFGENVYDFHMEFVEKRGKTEVEMFITTQQDGRIDLKDLNNLPAGGGVLDTIALALRIALWSLKTNRSNTFIFDQPMTNVSSDVLPRLAELLQDLSEKMDLQFIIVNHLVAFDNNKFVKIRIEKENNVSHVTDIN